LDDSESEVVAAHRFSQRKKVMAGFESEAFNALRDMLAGVSKEAIPEAEDAAAKVFLSAARAAAPVVSGRLRKSIAIIEGKDTGVLSTGFGGTTRRRLFVGPEWRKGYYGFFVEEGHKTAGPHRVRRSRSLDGRTHSQSGVETSKMVSARPWFEPAINASEPKALQAAEAAFNTKLQELNGKK
jgi:hypothetical protein